MLGRGVTGAVHSEARAAGWRPQPSFAHSIANTRQLELLNARGGIAVGFTPLRREVDLAFAGSQSASLSIWTTTSSSGFLSRPQASFDVVTIRFVESGLMTRFDRNGSDIVVAFDQAQLSSFEEMTLDEASPNFSSICATVRRDVLAEAWGQLHRGDPATFLQFGAPCDATTPALQALKTNLHALRRRLPLYDWANDLLLPLLEETIVYQLAGSWPTIGSAPLQYMVHPPMMSVRRAAEFIEEHLDRPISVAEIAAVAGTSVRSLQALFKRHFGCGPIQYMIGRRLDRVHAALALRDGRTVRDVANLWGFTHMSDFGRRYRDRFGHPPSQTRHV